MAGDREGTLKWVQDGLDLVVTGSSDYSKLSNLRDAIFELKGQYFNGGNGLKVDSEAKDELSRRFLLIEHEVDALLKRRIEYSTKDYASGERNLDFTNLLHEKECQVVELEKKIQNLEERLRRSTAREIELTTQITTIKADYLSGKGINGVKLEDAIRR